MEWMIASDSSCEIRTLPDTAPGVQFALVPFKIRVGEREFVDLPTLNTQAMLQAMTDYNGRQRHRLPQPGRMGRAVFDGGQKHCADHQP